MTAPTNDASTESGRWVDFTFTHEGASVHARRRLGLGAPVVFLHGFGDYADCWQGLLARLPESLDAVLVDSLGHGASGYPQSGCDSVARRDSIVSMLTDHIGPAVLVGHSMGAATALAVAAHRPDLALGLVLEDPPWWMHELDVTPAGSVRIGRDEPIVKWIEGLQEQSLEQVVADCKVMRPGWDEVEYEHWSRSKLQMNIAAVDLPFREIPVSVRSQWQAIRCPALLITGDASKGGIVTDEVAEGFLATVPSAQRSHHSRCGHDVRRDDPAMVAAAVTEFISKINAG